MFTRVRRQPQQGGGSLERLNEEGALWIRDKLSEASVVFSWLLTTDSITGRVRPDIWSGSTRSPSVLTLISQTHHPELLHADSHSTLTPGYLAYFAESLAQNRCFPLTKRKKGGRFEVDAAPSGTNQDDRRSPTTVHTD